VKRRKIQQGHDASVIILKSPKIKSDSVTVDSGAEQTLPEGQETTMQMKVKNPEPYIYWECQPLVMFVLITIS
jgi:hypothetical protein